MKTHQELVPGLPCMVDTVQPDPRTAAHFYGQLFEWTFQEHAITSGDASDTYLTALLDGYDASRSAELSARCDLQR